MWLSIQLGAVHVALWFKTRVAAPNTSVNQPPLYHQDPFITTPHSDAFKTTLSGAKIIQ